MAIHFYTSAPSALLAAFKKAINDKHVITWSYDDDGDFTHTHTQWAKLAWLRPKILSDRLQFNILNPQGKAVTWTIYGVYQGRFIESLTTHLHASFTLATATAAPTAEDYTGA